MSGGVHLACDAMAGTLHVQVDVELPAAWTVFFGHSGAGKTSLLRLLAGLWRPAGARVVLEGVDVTAVPPHRRGAVLVAQQAALFPHRSVRGNVAFGARDQATTEAMVQRFQLGALAARHVGALSGGEAQRVCLARAMAAAPRLLLLDESFTGLDRGLREELLRTLRELQKDRGTPIVSVTHDVGEAFACADEVLRIEAGRVTARGSAAEVLAPERAALLQRLSGQPA